MAEGSGGENGDGNEVSLASRIAARVIGKRHLRGVKLVATHHTVEDIARMVDRDEVEIDAFRADLVRVESGHTVVEPAGKGHAYF